MYDDFIFDYAEIKNFAAGPPDFSMKCKTLPGALTTRRADGTYAFSRPIRIICSEFT